MRTQFGSPLDWVMLTMSFTFKRRDSDELADTYEELFKMVVGAIFIVLRVRIVVEMRFDTGSGFDAGAGANASGIHSRSVW